MITQTDIDMLSPSQVEVRDKFEVFLMDDDAGEFIISGKAGTGKTFLIKYLADLADSTALVMKMISGKRQFSMHMTATTHKAAYVLEQKLGAEFPTSTIHSLLGLIVSNDFSTGRVNLRRGKDAGIVRNAVIFIDEASMVNKQLLDAIRDYTMNCKLVFIGDAYQLNPVKENISPVFGDLSKVHQLKEIHRQAQGNPIIELGDKFRGTIDGEGWPEIVADGRNIIKLSGEAFRGLISEKFRLDYNPDQSKIIAWSNKQVLAYNTHVRGLFTHEEAFQENEYVITNKPLIDGRGMSIAATDSRHKIICIEPAMHDDIEGYMVTLENDFEGFLPKDPTITMALMKHYAKNKNWESYFYFKDKILDLRSTYSLTTHKSQGSTYEEVFIDLSDIGRNTNWKETARLLYVAVTRASHRVYLYGELPKRYSPQGA